MWPLSEYSTQRNHGRAHQDLMLRGDMNSNCTVVVHVLATQLGIYIYRIESPGSVRPVMCTGVTTHNPRWKGDCESRVA